MAKRPPWPVKQPRYMTPQEWLTVLGHPEGIAAGCSQLCPSPCYHSIRKYIAKPRYRFRLFGDANMSYEEWRECGTVLMPNHRDRIQLAEPIGPVQRMHNSIGNTDISIAVKLAPYKPACVIAKENNLDLKKVTKYLYNHKPNLSACETQRANWDSRVLKAGLDAWLEQGYPARVYFQIERRNQ